MARTSLRKRLEAMKPQTTLTIPKDYEEATIRGVASRYGKETGRKYSVIKNTDLRVFTIVRKA